MNKSREPIIRTRASIIFIYTSDLGRWLSAELLSAFLSHSAHKTMEHKIRKREETQDPGPKTRDPGPFYGRSSDPAVQPELRHVNIVINARPVDLWPILVEA